MTQTSLLLELQNLDTRSDENFKNRDSIQTKLNDHSALDAANASLDAAARAANELKTKLKSLELETSSLTDKLKTVNERLYSGRISNAKELAGLNQDEKMLQRRKSEFEDRSLVLMEQIEAADNKLQAEQAARDKIAAATSKRNTQERAQLDDVEATLAALDRRRASLRSQLPVESLRVYDHLRQIKKGRAVSLVKGSNCSACGYEVPSGMLSRVRTGTELVFCGNCERILVLQ